MHFLIGVFGKLQKNDVKLELRKLQKTRSDKKTDSKVRIKVRNAGPYFGSLKNPFLGSDFKEGNVWFPLQNLFFPTFGSIFFVIRC